MTPFLNVIISNAIVASALAMVAFLVSKFYRRHPAIGHALWVLVLVKLVTPPLVALPVSVSLPDSFNVIETTDDGLTQTDSVMQNDSAEMVAATGSAATVEKNIAENNTQKKSAHTVSPVMAWGLSALVMLKSYQPFLVAMVWTVAALYFVFSVFQIIRFHRRLMSLSADVSPEIHSMAAELSSQLGIRRCPEIMGVHARISPMVWWVGGAVRIVFPVALLKSLSTNECRMLLAHELAHVKRGDYFVRSFELVVRCLFWWHPAVWWSQSYLRDAEEQCCDAMVVAECAATRGEYAESLLKAVEYLTNPNVAAPLPVFASGMNSGGNTKRRFQMILGKHVNSRLGGAAKFSMLLLVFGILPLSMQLQEAVQANVSDAVAAIETPASTETPASPETQKPAVEEKPVVKIAQKNRIAHVTVSTKMTVSVDGKELSQLGFLQKGTSGKIEVVKKSHGESHKKFQMSPSQNGSLRKGIHYKVTTPSGAVQTLTLPKVLISQNKNRQQNMVVTVDFNGQKKVVVIPTTFPLVK